MLNGHVQFAANAPLRLYDVARDLPGLDGPRRVLGTTAPLAHPALTLKFPVGAVTNVRVWAFFLLLLDGPPRRAPVRWVYEAFRAGRKIGYMRPTDAAPNLWISTGEWEVDEVRILATNAPGDGQGIIVLLNGSFDNTG
jgi:hypothetical protein